MQKQDWNTIKTLFREKVHVMTNGRQIYSLGS